MNVMLIQSLRYSPSLYSKAYHFSLNVSLITIARSCNYWGPYSILSQADFKRLTMQGTILKGLQNQGSTLTVNRIWFSPVCISWQRLFNASDVIISQANDMPREYLSHQISSTFLAQFPIITTTCCVGV